MKPSASVGNVGETYASWMGETFGRLFSEKRDAVSMLASSVSEPLALLRSLAAKNFTGELTPCYQMVIVGNNKCLSRALSKRYGAPEENILCTTGVMAGLSFLYRVLLNPGERVLVEEPGFDIFWDFATAMGVGVDFFQRSAPSFQVDPDVVLARITPKTRMIVLSNLHNPSGAMLSEDVIARLAKGAQAKNVIVVVDEVYRDYAEIDGAKTPAQASAPNIVRLNSLTKTYGLSSLRCGWIIADLEVMEVLRRAYFKFEFNNSKLTHALAAQLLSASDEFDAHVRNEIGRSRKVAIDGFGDMRARGLLEFEMPDYGCIFFPKIVGVKNTRRLAEWLVSEKGLYTVPGEFYRGAGFLRLGFAIEPATLERAITRLSEGLEQYRRVRTHDE